MKQKRNFIEWAMHYRGIVILVVCCLVAFGIYSLPQMRKNEFPDFTVRQGVVVAVAPGLSAEEMAEQVAKPLENYIFTYKEVKKQKTFSQCRDGIVYVQVELNDELKNKDEFWSKFKHGVSDFQRQLPQNVLALMVQDDFGDTSALLITMESRDKTYRELRDYMDGLQDELRKIPSVGRLTVQGLQQEQITVVPEARRLTQYGLTEQGLALQLLRQGFVTSGGRIRNAEGRQPVYVARSLNSVRDVAEQIVYADPQGNVVRLRDVARITREYPAAESFISNNGKKCLLLSVEMKRGQNIVQMGKEIDRVIADFGPTLPREVSLFRITDQSQVVGESVQTFLTELLIAILAVVLVVVLLLPLRVALVAASTIPLTIFISLGLFYAFGIELNTVTLAALIVTLGMIVDNSIVIIDSYLEKLSEGCSRWYASIWSTQHFFKSIFSATLAISITFFPFLLTTKGMIQEFLTSFPWAITLVLGISLLVAVMLVPFLQFWFIRKPMKTRAGAFSFLGLLQKYYDRLVAVCFRYPRTTLLVGLLSVGGGIWLMSSLPMRLMPTADRNQFAIEIYLPSGSSIEETAAVADSLEHLLRRDARVVSVASFKGCASPRFQNSYAPQIAGPEYAQFIVNTTGADATVALLDEFQPRYADYFPGAIVRFKQLSYSQAVYPVEVRLSGGPVDTLRAAGARVRERLQGIQGLSQVRTNFLEPQSAVEVRLRPDASARLGVTTSDVETSLALRYGDGIHLADVWEDDYRVSVQLKGERADTGRAADVADEQIAIGAGLSSVPLRQVAEVTPVWKNGQIVRRNGVPCLTVYADLERGVNAMAATEAVKEALVDFPLPEGVSVTFGGEDETTADDLPPILSGLAIAAALIFFILLAHFCRVGEAALIFSSLLLCLLGAAFGIWVHGVDFGVTCVLGITALMGIIVRNGIIMFDYAEELRREEHLCVRDAIFLSAKRRMRPIFLTSAAASMGVIPMILGGSSLWMPMGVVICYGTVITMVFLLTVLPVAYWLCFRGSTRQRAIEERLEQE